MWTPSDPALAAALDGIFADYERLAAGAEALFASVSRSFPDCVTCRAGCSDCCHAVFDLSLVEAMHLNRAFQARFGHGPQRSAILQNAAEADRTLTRMKREYFRTVRDSLADQPSARTAANRKNSPDAAAPDQADQAAQAMQNAVDRVLTDAARVRSRCPLLTEEGRCALYEARPITCRLYGIPLDLGGESHVCGLSAFSCGQSYPNVQMGKIQERLDALSLAIQTRLGSRYSELHQVYVPVSMALLTVYDDKWLGLGPATPED